jgi:hypothetical protein
MPIAAQRGTGIDRWSSHARREDTLYDGGSLASQYVRGTNDD